MPAVKMAAMSDKGRPADKAATKTAAMEAMETAAVKAPTTVKAAAAVTAAVATAAPVTAAAAADLDQSVGDEFCGRRRRARTRRRQRCCTLRRHQHQHRRRDHACRGGEQTSSIHARVVNEKCNGTRFVGHNKSIPENARRCDVSQRRPRRIRHRARPIAPVAKLLSRG